MAVTAKAQKVRLSSIARSENEWKDICANLGTSFIPALGEKIIFCDDTGNNLYYCIGDGKTPLYTKTTSKNEKGEEITEWSNDEETTLIRSQSMAPVSFKATNVNAPDYLHQEPADDNASTNSEYQIASEAEVDALHNANSALEIRLDALETTTNGLAQIVTGLSNPVQYKGTVEEVPTDNSGYEAGNVITIKSTGKEYIFDGTKWDELGDATQMASIASQVESLKTELYGNNEKESRIDSLVKRTDGLEEMETGMFGKNGYGTSKTISSNNLPKASTYNGQNDQGRAGIVYPRRDQGLVISDQGYLGLRQAQVTDLQKVIMEKNDVAYAKDSQGKDSYGWFPVFTGNIGYLINKYLNENYYPKYEDIGQWLEDSYNLISGGDTDTQVNPNEQVSAWCIEDIVNAIKDLQEEVNAIKEILSNQ